MNAGQLFVGMMDSFDGIYSDVTQSERIKVTRDALVAKVHEKEGAEPYGGQEGNEMLIDGIVSLMVKEGPITREQLVALFLSILDVSSSDLGSSVDALVASDRIVPTINRTAERLGLTPLGEEDMRKDTLIFSKKVDSWDVVLGYFPSYVYHHHLYGSYAVQKRIVGKVMMSMFRSAPERGTGYSPNGPETVLDLTGFLKSEELDHLASKYGISYHAKPDRHGQHVDAEHLAHGGYDAMVRELDQEVAKFPYSAEKLMREARCPVDILFESDAASIHLFARDKVEVDSRAHTEANAPAFGLVMGFDFLKLPKSEWAEAKAVPPAAFTALANLEGKCKTIEHHVY